MNDSTGGGTAPPTAVHRLPRSQGIAYVAAVVVEALFAIIGNLVVLAVFGKNRQLRRRKSHWLLINQAVADLLAGLIIGPYLLNYILHNFDLSDYSMDLYVRMALGTMAILLTVGSFSNLVMIALERAHAAFTPIQHRALSVRNYRVAIVVVWLHPALLDCLLVAKELEKIPDSTFYYILAFNMCGFFLIVVSSYSCIWIKFKCSSIAPQNDLRAAQERKLTASLFLVTAASSMSVLGGMVASFNGTIHARMLAVLLGGVTLFINPIIYSLKMPGFRRAAIRLICGSHPRSANAVLPLQTVPRNRGNGRL